MNPWVLFLSAWLAAAVLMLAIWLLQRATGNAGFVDVAWTLGVGTLAVFFAVVETEGDIARRWIVAVLAGAWALRLAGHILWRVLTTPEDGRYVALKKQWGPSAQWRLLLFYQYQALGCVLFAVPMWIAARNQAPLGWLDGLAVAIWLMAIGGEALADWQLSRFRLRTKERGKVCRDGLWRYSRHPNYFFEWLHWWCYVALAIAAPWGWVTLLGPLAMYYFITRVTGIPPTEAQAVQSRGAAYREYQRTTSPFFPWPPKPSTPE
ncbi:MAG: DUF1295 domain-containing protein [Pirellulaceae bacterium]|nr:DUF1295 domain-containing protein [Pirellulaceae bacterium]